jgi:hypothetical protein
MKLYNFVSIVVAGSLLLFPELSLAHGGGGGGHGGGGGGHGFGGGGGGHGFGGAGFGGHGFSARGFGGHGFGASGTGVNGRAFGSGFNRTRGFAGRGFSDRTDRGRFGDRGFRGRDRGFRDFEGDSFDFGFYGFGYPDYYQYDYPYYYPYPYYNYNGYPSVDQSRDYRRSGTGDVTFVVQSELSKRGYYEGPIDGVIGAGSRRAIRSFQTDQGLPSTGSINRKLLSALRVG